jgi:hypothetical protein
LSVPTPSPRRSTLLSTVGGGVGVAEDIVGVGVGVAEDTVGVGAAVVDVATGGVTPHPARASPTTGASTASRR